MFGYGLIAHACRDRSCCLYSSRSQQGLGDTETMFKRSVTYTTSIRLPIRDYFLKTPLIEK
jgi:hypothetical protein